MEDDLHATLEAAFDAAPEQSTPEVSAPVETPAEVAKPEAEGRARDESGRFTAKQQQEQADQQAAAAKIDPAPVPPVVQPQVKQAPSSWKAEAKAIWDKASKGEAITPQEFAIVQAEAERREGDFHKGTAEWKTHAETGRAYEKALAPYQQTLQQLNVDGVTAVSALLKADHILRNAPESVKVQEFLKIAQQYGIDLNKQFSPDVSRYEQELFQTKEQLKQIQQQAMEQSSMAVNSDIERFASAPGHEHFAAVRVHMASLLESGAAKDMDAAYDMAVYANPETRATLLEQQRRSQEEANRTQRASAAAVSVKGSSPANGAPSATRASLRGDIEAAFDNHS